MKTILVLFSFMLSLQAQAATPCSVETFQKKICISATPQNINGEDLRAPCDPQSQYPDIVNDLTAAFNIAPPWFQKHLCGLQKVLVHPLTEKYKGVISWSYHPPVLVTGVGMEFYKDKNGFTLARSADIGLRQTMWKKKLKEEGFPVDYGLDRTKNVSGAAALLYLAHEIAHLIYNTDNKVLRNKLFDDCLLPNVCLPYAEGSFGFFDWIDGDSDRQGVRRGKIRAENADLWNFVSAQNTSTVSLKDVDNFYLKLKDSSFVSAFALMSPEEDFCETLAWTVLQEAIGSWNFQLSSGQQMDFLSPIRNPTNTRLQQKIDFIKSLNKN